MSLTTENIEGSLKIATICKANKIGQIKKFLPEEIYLIDNKNISERATKLKNLRVTKPDEIFFIEPRDYEIEDEEGNKIVQTDKIFISGPSGCGKSTWVRNYCLAFHRKYPKAKVLLFSSKEKDIVLDDLKYVQRLDINEDIINEPFSMEELAHYSKPILTIFDDVQDFKSKKVTAEVARLRDEILRNGRSSNIFCVYIYHDPSSYHKTKEQVFECNKVVTYPKKSGKGTYDYFYNKKLHLDKDILKAINKLNSEWVCINKEYPQYVISDKYIILDSN